MEIELLNTALDVDLKLRGWLEGEWGNSLGSRKRRRIWGKATRGYWTGEGRKYNSFMTILSATLLLTPWACIENNFAKTLLTVLHFLIPVLLRSMNGMYLRYRT